SSALRGGHETHAAKNRLAIARIHRALPGRRKVRIAMYFTTTSTPRARAITLLQIVRPKPVAFSGVADDTSVCRACSIAPADPVHRVRKRLSAPPAARFLR